MKLKKIFSIVLFTLFIFNFNFYEICASNTNPQILLARVDSNPVSSDGGTSTPSGSGNKVEPLSDFSDESQVDVYKPSISGGFSKVFKKANVIIGSLQAIGTVVSVIMLTVIGIKLMLGSVEEKSEYKQFMWKYVLGAITLLFISNIIAVIYNFAQEFM